MPDYKEMYLTMFRATEKAVNLLIAAQQECEERYISTSDSEEMTIFTAQEQEKAANGK